MAEYIYNADFLIAPIFEGSGMKLKTAEALMYGKPYSARQRRSRDMRSITNGWRPL